MTQQTHPAGARPSTTGTNSGWVAGGVAFAGVLMVCNGVLAILQGIAAIATDEVYDNVGSYVYRINLTGWGWIHLIIGVAVLLAGAGVLRGASWARYVGILLAAVSLVFQFLFLPYSPVWSVIVIAIDLFVIWALASYHPQHHSHTT
ncbi:hypothetical protein [Streptomyces sp. NPDC051098]|uniref:DUF7144 family membrane protein n=1 Tax=Streptomyces sp. NPDC051098 TaxID=3155411 RepID=UPI00343A3C11